MTQPLTHNRARRSIWHAALIFSALSWLAIGAVSSSVVFAQGDKRAIEQEQPFKNVSVFHDEVRGVTCWVFHYDVMQYSVGGISCLPDNQIGGK